MTDIVVDRLLEIAFSRHQPRDSLRTGSSEISRQDETPTRSCGRSRQTYAFEFSEPSRPRGRTILSASKPTDLHSTQENLLLNRCHYEAE